MEVDYGTAIVGTIQFAIGSGFGWLGQELSRRINSPVIRVLLSWPCYGLAFLFLTSAAFIILWNMFGPFVLWIFGLVTTR
jgi:hypothetical protein